MGTFSDVLLVSDLDGTIFNKTGQLTEQNAEALHSFIDRGGRFTVATGRALHILILHKFHYITYHEYITGISRENMEREY